MTRLVEELRRRNVLRVAAAYALVAWILIEAGSVLLPTFGASEDFFRIYAILIIGGWFVAVIVAWAYEITPEGVKRERDVDRTAYKPAPGSRWNFIIIGLLAIALGVSITLNITGIRDLPVVGDRVAGNSIAVLPFTNRSSEPDSEYFTDAIHDDLLTRLAEIDSLRVISRTSVLAYRDSQKNLEQIGDELGVDVIVEGAVQQAGDQVRITIQLIDADTDEHLWVGTYDRELSLANLFDLQSEISSTIANELRAALTPEDMRRLAAVPTTNEQAYRLYQSAREGLDERRFESTMAARRQFESAISLDPEFAQAHAALAETIMLLAINHRAVPFDEAFRLASAYVERSLELEPYLAEAHAVKGLIETHRWLRGRIGDGNLRAAASLERAIELKHNLVSAHLWYSSLFEYEGRFDDAIRLQEKALDIDPLSRIPHVTLPSLLAAQGKNDEAIDLLLTARELFPDWSIPADYMTSHLERMGRLAEAVAWGQESLSLTDDPLAGLNAVPIYIELGMVEQLIRFARNFPEGHPMNPVGTGVMHFLLGDFQAALDSVESEEVWKSVPLEMVATISIPSAIMIGDYDKAWQHMLQSFPALTSDEPLVADRFNLGFIVLAGYLEQQRGNADHASVLLRLALDYTRTAPRMGMWGYGIRDAEVLALLGRPEAAIDALQDAVDAGFVSLRPFELWSIDQSPLIDSLRSNPRYEAIRGSIEHEIDIARRLVEEAEAEKDGWANLRARTERT